MSRRIGWDVGGAHLKAALAEDGRLVRVIQIASPLWRGLDWLQEALADALRRLGSVDRHAATMTGELADIFPDRATGVARITAMLAGAVAPAPLAIYAPGGFLAAAEAPSRAAEVASANWHATAALLGRDISNALLVDMGSTTTDLVPVSDGRPCPCGLTDAARLTCGELVYTGLVRTPLMAVADRAPFLGAWTTPAREYFATMSDVYRLLGVLPPDADLLPAADNREKSTAASRARLARMVGRDADDATDEAWTALAGWFAEQQLRQITDGAMQVLSRTVLPADAPVVTAGAGRRVAARLASRLGRPERDFATLPAFAQVPLAAECAPAVAMALLEVPEETHR